jgi:hypothetical protein
MRKVFLTLAFVVLFCFVSAQAQQPQPTPRFGFLTKDKITLQGGQPSTLLLQNNTAESLTIDLKVIDIEPKQQNPISAAVKVDPQTVQLQPMAPWTITVSYTPKDSAPAAARKGYLVAVERGKQDFDRREIEVAETKSPATESNAPSPVPADVLESIGLQGTNYLPSLLSFGWPALALSLIAIVLVIAFWRGYLQNRVVHIVGSIVLITVSLILGAIADHTLDSRKLSLIKIRRVPLTIGKDINAGVISPEGFVGRIEANGTELSVKDLSRAGTYDGQLKLGPEKDARTVKVSAKISDWWPYALLAIILGVYLGYRVTRYFNQQRGEDALRLRSAQLLQKIVDDEARFQSAHKGLPFATYNILDLAEEWLRLVDRDIAQHDVAGGGARLDRLATYADLFARFRERLKRLYELQSAAWERIKHGPFALNRNTVKVLREADKLFAEPLPGFPEEDEQGTQLKKYQARAETLIDWVSMMESYYESIVGFLEDAESIDKSQLEPEGQKQLQTQIAALRKAAHDVLLADSKDDLGSYYDDAQAAINTIRELVEKTTDRILPSAATRSLRSAKVTAESALERISETLQLERLLSSIRYKEWQMTIIAGLLTAGLGLYTLYLSKTVWGTTADYLYALLWGSVLSEGLKYGANIVSRIWKP